MDAARREILTRRYVRAVLRAVGLDVRGVRWPDGALDAYWAALRMSKEAIPSFAEFCQSIGEPLDEERRERTLTEILRGA